MEACVFGCCDRMNFMITNVINRFPGVEGQGVKDVARLTLVWQPRMPHVALGSWS